MTIEHVIERLAPDGHAVRTGTGWLVRCPGHEDSTPSLAVAVGRNGAVVLRCHAGCTVEAVCAAAGLRLRDLWPATAGRREGGRWHPLQPREDADGDTPERRARRERWPQLTPPSASDLERLHDLRGIGLGALRLAAHRELLRITTWAGERAWVVTDSSRRVAQVRRLDGHHWTRPDGGVVKTLTLPGSLLCWPVGQPETAQADGILLCEGGPDLLAAHEVIGVEGREHDVAAIALLGASLELSADAARALAGKAVVIFAHADLAGHRAAARWARALRGHAREVEVVTLDGLRQEGGAPVTDLCDLMRIAPDDWEANPWLWELCPRQAEVPEVVR